jgi:hypothetical protein
MKTHFRTFTVLLLAAVLLSACNMPSAQVTTPTVALSDLVATSAAQTVEALTTQLAQQQPSATQQPTATQAPPATATLAAVPTNTIAPIILSSPTPAVVATTAICDRAQFVADVTVPDGTQYKAGETFTKTWRLKNIGTCTWSTSYKMIFKSGNSMEGPASINLPKSVAPNETIDLSVTLKAPATNGDYTGNYLLMNANSVEFGLGASAKEVFYVKIKVGSGTSPSVTPGGPTVTPGGVTATPTFFAVTRVNLTSDTTNFVGACPKAVTVSAQITTNRAGTIQYYFTLNGVAQTLQSLAFDKADTKTVTFPLNIEADGSTAIGWFNQSPNNQGWGPVTITVDCTP